MRTKIYKKTVYDPAYISNDDMIKWANEALEMPVVQITSNGQKLIRGVAENGLKFEGWMDVNTNVLKSFYPVLKWVD